MTDQPTQASANAAFDEHLERLEAAALASTEAWRSNDWSWDAANEAFLDEVSDTAVVHLFAELRATRALLDQVRDHVLDDRAHAHCPIRALLSEEN